MHKNQIVLIFSAVLFHACSLAQELDPGSNPNAKGKNLYTYYIKAAEAGSPFAQLAIAGCYDAGEGVSKDQQQALKWYRKAAENDLPYAQYVIAWKYLEGDGVPKNVEAAENWLRKAGTNGSSAAQCKLGEMYFAGDGVKKDTIQAINWFHKAAEQGEVLGQNNLGYIYANGKGVPKDYVEAYKWFCTAARGTNEKVPEILRTLEEQMSKEQIANAKQSSVELAKQIAITKDRLDKEAARRVLKWREDIENTNKKYSSNHQAQKLLSDADVGLAPGPPVSMEHGGTATTIDFQSHPQRDRAGWAILACAVGFLVVLLLWLYFAPGSREAARSALIADARMAWLFFSPGLRGRSPLGSLPPAIEAVSSATPNGTMPRSETTSVHAYFILQNNETQGPYSIEELRSLWNNGTITGETFYCEQGYDEWLRLEKIVDCLQSASADRTSAEQSRTNLPAPLSPPAISFAQPTPTVVAEAYKETAAHAARGPWSSERDMQIWFLVRPLVLGVARVKENYLLLSFIAVPFSQPWRTASTGEVCRVSRGVRPLQGGVGGRWRLWRAVRVEIAQPGSRLSLDPGA